MDITSQNHNIGVNIRNILVNSLKTWIFMLTPVSACFKTVLTAHPPAWTLVQGAACTAKFAEVAAMLTRGIHSLPNHFR